MNNASNAQKKAQHVRMATRFMVGFALLGFAFSGLYSAPTHATSVPSQSDSTTVLAPTPAPPVVITAPAQTPVTVNVAPSSAPVVEVLRAPDVIPSQTVVAEQPGQSLVTPAASDILTKDAAPQAEDTENANDINPDKILSTLRQSNGPPLTLSQLAAINDALKKMEYVKDIETKIQSMQMSANTSSSTIGLGAPGSSVISPMGGAPFPPPSGNSAPSTDQPVVLRVYALQGVFKAVVLINKQQQTVEVGDSIGGVKVIDISLAGVRVSQALGGVSMLPFATVNSLQNVTVAVPRK